jgi:hypothetical protein
MSMRNEPGYFSERYRWRVDKNNPSWQAYRFICFLLTWGRDAAFPLWKAQQLDHIGYRFLYREIPLVDVIPLSIVSHKLVTKLRDEGYRFPVNLYLRCAGVCWLSLDFLILSAIACLVSGHFEFFVHLIFAMTNAAFSIFSFVSWRAFR